jgi:hypothetical protein
MSTANPLQTAAPANSRVSNNASGGSGHHHLDLTGANGHHHHESAGPTSVSGTNAAKKAKNKKATDPNEASKLIAAKISQLELDAAGEKDQEAEIGTCGFYPRFQKNCFYACGDHCKTVKYQDTWSL